MNMTDSTPDSFDSYSQDFYSHFWSHYGTSGLTFEDYLPAYQYGYELAHDQRYSDMEWSRLELRARLYWEGHFESDWEDFRDAVAYAWNRVRAAVV
jgi:hypothetical protein